MFGLAVIPAVLLFVGMLMQRESPHWLIMRGRDDQAREVLSRLRENPQVIDDEIHDVRKVTEIQALGISDLLAKNRGLFPLRRPHADRPRLLREEGARDQGPEPAAARAGTDGPRGWKLASETAAGSVAGADGQAVLIAGRR
jgi:hypothetical protein